MVQRHDVTGTVKSQLTILDQCHAIIFDAKRGIGLALQPGRHVFLFKIISFEFPCDFEGGSGYLTVYIENFFFLVIIRFIIKGGCYNHL